MYKRQVGKYANSNPPPIKKNITVDAIVNASSDRKNGWKAGIQVKLPKGIWEIKPVSGGWSAWSFNSDSPNGKAWTWNVSIKRPFIEQSFSFGPKDWWQFKSAEEAFNYVQMNLDRYTFNMPQPDTVFFWIRDGGGASNNRGYVTIEISRKE